MIVGTKEAAEIYKTEKPERYSEVVEPRMKWVSDSIWYIPEEDDDKWYKLLAKELENKKTISSYYVPPNVNIDKLSFRPLKAKAAAIIHQTPKTNKPPAFWSKVKSFWKAVTGPKVSEEIFQERYKKCTETGGYTFSPVSGIVTSIDNNTVLLDNKYSVTLKSDETPAVKVGDEIEEYQIIATGTVKKPCQYMVTNSKGNFCGACGCGTERNKAELKTKLYYATVSCPRIPPLFEAEEVK